MKCFECKEGILEKKQIEDVVEIDPDLPISVSKLTAQVCPVCGDIIMDSETAQKRDREVLYALAHRFLENPAALRGKAAQWMRKEIGLSLEKWGEMSGMDPSSFTKAAQRNSELGYLPALQLVMCTIDFLAGKPIASNLRDELNKKLETELKKVVVPHARNVKFG